MGSEEAWALGVAAGWRRRRRKDILETKLGYECKLNRKRLVMCS